MWKDLSNTNKHIHLFTLFVGKVHIKTNFKTAFHGLPAVNRDWLFQRTVWSQNYVGKMVLWRRLSHMLTTIE